MEKTEKEKFGSEIDSIILEAEPKLSNIEKILLFNIAESDIPNSYTGAVSVLFMNQASKIVRLESQILALQTLVGKAIEEDKI